MAASDMNLVVLSGRLVKDPEPRGEDGKVAHFSIASNRFFKSGDGPTQEEVTYIDCTAFGYEAEGVLSKLGKGSSVTLEGRLELNRWTADDETTRSKIRLVVNRVHATKERSAA
jgi:single-strand DNA-binding protein